MHGWCLKFEDTEYWVLTGKEKGSCFETENPNLERDLRFFEELYRLYKQ